MIYKICSQGAWCLAEASGRYAGSEDDARHGFIHFSRAEQLQGTAAKHFSGQKELVLVAVNEALLGAALKWELSRGGAHYPHLYQELDVSLVEWIKPLPLNESGLHVFPDGIS